jgi:hypothetical protein
MATAIASSVVADITILEVQSCSTEVVTAIVEHIDRAIRRESSHVLVKMVGVEWGERELDALIAAR